MFDALNILKPGWYFNHQKARHVWPDYRTMDSKAQSFLKPDHSYRSEAAHLIDLAYQSLQLQVPANNVQALTVGKIAPSDEYRFIAKYFSKIWLPYFLLYRICRFKNPVVELIGLLRAINIPRIKWSEIPMPDINLPPLTLDDYPEIAVIIPTLNRFAYLEDALNDLYAQDYPNIEIIVVDQSDEVPEDFLERHKNRITYIHQEEKALWLARNMAIETTKAEYILLFDDDSRVKTDWISMHLNGLIHFNASISSGISLSQTGDKIPENYQSFRISDQLDTGNALIRRDVFREIGLFDRQFEKQRMGDGEFGLRAFLAGFVNISNPQARRIHLKVSSGGLRQHGHWDGWRTISWFAVRPVPSVLYLCRKYWGNRVALHYVAIHILPSVLPYRSKGKRWKLLLYIPLSPFILAALAIQVSRSWRRSTAMLKKGALISALTI